MSVVNVTEIWKGRQASRNIGNVREYTRTFLVQVDTALDGPFVVGATGVTGIPPLFAYYRDQEGFFDRGAIVQTYEVKQTDEPTFWEVDVKYSSAISHFSPRMEGKSGRSGKAEQADKGSTDDNPLNRPIVCKITGSRFQRPVWHDLKTGAAIVNSAGDVFEPVPEIDDTRLIYTIDRNEAARDDSKLANFQDAVNADSWAGFEPGRAKCNLSCESAYENGLKYWKYTYVVEVRRMVKVKNNTSSGTDTYSPWHLLLLQRGNRYLDGSNNPVNVYDKTNGSVVNGQVFLNNTGGILTPAYPASNPLVAEFQVYLELNYAGQIPFPPP